MVNKKIVYIIFSCILITVIFCILIVYSSYNWFSDSSTISERLGNWGQFLSGTIGLIFSFLAFVGVILAYYLQNKQIQQLEEEAKIRSFENNFYEMYNIFLKIIDNLSFKKVIKHTTYLNNDYSKPKYNYKDDGTVVMGVNSFENAFGLLFDIIENYKDLLGIDESLYENKSSMNLFALDYNYFMLRTNNIFGRYFRSLYNILKYINNFKEKNKNIDVKIYTNFIRANLSREEQLFLFANSFHPISKPENKPESLKTLIEKYGLFEHIDFNELETIAVLLNAELMDIIRIYKPSAYNVEDYDSILS